MWLSHFQIGGISEIASDETYNGPTLISEIEKRKEELLKIGVRPGMRAILYQRNSISFFIDLLALWLCEACVIPLDGQSQELVKRGWEAWLKPHLIRDTSGKLRLNVGQLSIWPREIALGLLTSGSTGRPRLTLHTGDAIASKLKALSMAISREEHEVSLCALPTYFGHGLICNSLFPLMHGSHLVLANSFAPHFIAELDSIIRRRQIRFLSSTPAIWSLISECANFQPKPNLKRVHCASAVLDAGRAETLRHWSGDASTWNVYGLTEFLGWVTGAQIDDANPHVGGGWSTETHVDEKSEILLRSRYRTYAYLDAEDPNELKLIQQDQWFHTRDRGEWKDEKLRILGRMDFVINKGGLKIQPEEVESILASHPSVSDSLCGSLPDPLWGEKLAAIVALKPSSAVTQDELRDWLACRLPSYKVPDCLSFLPKIPRSARGKVNRSRFLDLWEETGG